VVFLSHDQRGDLTLYCHKEGHREGGTIAIFGPPPFQTPSAK
jgi:hypothetical protein